MDLAIRFSKTQGTKNASWYSHWIGTGVRENVDRFMQSRTVEQQCCVGYGCSQCIRMNFDLKHFALSLCFLGLDLCLPYCKQVTCERGPKFVILP